MKIVTVLGTRPEIIRLSRIIPRLDELCEHVLVHTGQNYTASLSDLFFAELGLRAPDHSLGVRADSFGGQAGQILERMEGVLDQERPDGMLILGDTNSGLAAVAAKRRGIRVFHMEAGNRCRDDRVPEEVNRRIIDHSSDVLMPYTERSRANLLVEGISPERILVTGNPIREVMLAHENKVAASNVLERLGVAAGGYFLVTLHRQENVDDKPRLEGFVRGLELVCHEFGLPAIVSVHPRTRSRMEAFGLAAGEAVRFMEPFGFFDFLALEKAARCVLSDSGTVQEECCILGVPNVTLRDTTERPETLECGSGMLSGGDPRRILACARAVLSLPATWTPPTEYLATDVTSVVVKCMLGHHNFGDAAC